MRIFGICLVMLLLCTVPPLTAAEPGRKLPDFLKKVQLHNFAGVEPTEDGEGVRLYRLPGNVRAKLTEKNKHSDKSGADQMRYARHSEIRFVLKEGEKPQNVKLHLQSTKPAQIVFYWGDVFCGSARLRPGGKARPVRLRGHGLLYNLMDKIPAGRFPNRLCRIVLSGGELTLSGIEGEIRPPRPEDLPPVMMSYGTSITEGHAASRTDLAWNSLTARRVGHDLVNLGSSGTAFCQSAVADYMAARPWDLCVLEISVNMVGNDFSVDQFRRRATYMVNTLAESHPEAPIFCISLFPWGIGDYWTNSPQHKKARQYRETLREICEESSHGNVHFVSGPDLLSMTGLSRDLLHPSDHGMIEIADKLSERIRAVLKDSPDR